MTFVANIAGIQTGTFTNPDTTYYSAPQALNAQGLIVGHTHFTVQDMGANANPQAALDPTKFAFFKGVDGPADGAGNVAATATGGLPAGNYRVCTMAGAANHQPVIVAAAQRGGQDDCVRFSGKFNLGLLEDVANSHQLVKVRLQAPQVPQMPPLRQRRQLASNSSSNKPRTRARLAVARRAVRPSVTFASVATPVPFLSRNKMMA
jgi:hypothetical protein